MDNAPLVQFVEGLGNDAARKEMIELLEIASSRNNTFAKRVGVARAFIRQ
jgi:hypothetical protein